MKVRLLLVFFLLLAAPGTLSAAPEWREGMPWFDNPKDDYREYKPEDLKLKSKQRGPQFSAPAAGMDPTILFYAIGAVLIGVLIYFVLRYLANRQPEEESPVEEGIEIQVVDLPEAKLPDLDLRRMIDELIAQGNFRRAGMLLFQIVCNQFRLKNLLQITQDQTPREIRRAFSGEPVPSGLLSDAVHVFEDCAYRPADIEASRVTSLRERVYRFSETEN